MNELKITRTSWSEHAPALSAIRKQVFVDEQRVPLELELDEDDASATHFLASIGPENRPIATARLLANGHVGRMAVLKTYRNQSVGNKLLSAIIETARQFGYPELFLNAQVTALGFYEKAGFKKQGDIFMDAGIPHQRMSRKLT